MKPNLSQPVSTALAIDPLPMSDVSTRIQAVAALEREKITVVVVPVGREADYLQ